MKALTYVKRHFGEGKALAANGRRLPFVSIFQEIVAFVSGGKKQARTHTGNHGNLLRLFNSLSDMVLILDAKGRIVRINRSALDQLKYKAESLQGRSIDFLLRSSEPFLWKLDNHKSPDGCISFKSGFYDFSGAAVPVLLTVTSITGRFENDRGMILTARDLRQKNDELITDTREKERLRLAQDLHDSLWQRLSAAKFFMDACTGGNLTSEEQNEGMLKSREALAEAMAEMRDICFDLMPVTITELALVKAVKEACGKFRRLQSLEFQIREINEVPCLPKKLETDLFRVIQEFITNTVKHGEASKVRITFYEKNSVLKIILRDNGKGFDAKNAASGMGLQNARGRVRSHNGTLQVISAAGKGVAYFINVPIQTRL
jgi:PAS domain S-box-containing protein